MIFNLDQIRYKINDLLNEIFQIAEEYDSTKTYAVDDYCTYEGKILRCTSATSGAFDSSAWTDAVIVMNAIKAIKARLTAAESNISTAQSDISAAQDDISALNLSFANIGTVVDSGAIGNTSIATGTYLDIGSISLTKGTWILFAKCVYSSNATGLRVLQFGGITQEQTIQVAAGTTGLIGLTTSSMATLTSTTTVRARCWQNSGSALNVSGRIFAVRIA